LPKPAHWSNYARRLYLKWLKLLPPSLAAKQAMWERCATIRRAHDLGVSYRKIGKAIGISGATVAIYLERAKRHNIPYGPSPLEKYFNQKLDLRILSGLDRPPLHDRPPRRRRPLRQELRYARPDFRYY